MSRLPEKVMIIWHDGPKMQALYRELKRAGILIDMPGKGRSVWMSLGIFLQTRKSMRLDCTTVIL